jgi:hypothetical protein
VITRFVINHLVTVIWENFSPGQSPAVRSKVLDLLRPRAAPWGALPRSLESGSARSAEAALATCEGIAALAGSSTSLPSTCQESAFVCRDSNGQKLSNGATRQQFLLAMLEDCSFFAHLVLRCVRAARGSPHRCPRRESATPQSNSRPTPAMQVKAQPISNLLVRPNPATVATEPLSLQTLWVDVAYRHARTPPCPGGMS